MKKLLFFWAITCFAITCLFPSCEEDTTTINMPNVSLRYATNAKLLTYIKNGDVLDFSISLNQEKSSAGVKIDRVDYYWDGDKITTAVGPDFKYSEIVSQQSLGEHTLSYNVHCSGKGYSNTTIKSSFKFLVVNQYPVLNFIVDYPQEITNGEVFTCTLKQDESNTLDVSIVKVSYLWDDKEVLDSYNQPYLLSYPLNGERTGEHTLKVKVTVSGEWSGSITYPYKVTVK